MTQRRVKMAGVRPRVVRGQHPAAHEIREALLVAMKRDRSRRSAPEGG
ncbi:MAG TPA: hypothetical protein VMO26_20030 [Vicinamibacterales bacterium]|nr:hypothetical protein [Vicinamibacterales bacterium]